MSVLSEAKILELAHRRATKYTHRTTPGETAYGFTAQHLIDFVRNDIEAAVLEAQGKQEPVACPDKGPWSEGKTDDGRVYIESEDFEHDVRLYVDGDFAEGDCKHYAERMAAWMNAAPVVQPDMVMVPREPTEAMLDAAMNRYQHVSPEAKARYTQMHRENFRCDYKAMIAAAEGKSNA